MKKIFILSILLIGLVSTSLLNADEREDKWYSTSGNYYDYSHSWYNSNHNVTTTSGFKYGQSQSGKGDLVAVRHDKWTNDKVQAGVKNADGQTRYSSWSYDAYADIGARRGTDYHMLNDK